MNTKPISPKIHGLNDYGFAAALLFAPSIFGFNKKAKKLYALLGTNLFLYNAITDHPVSVKRLISYDTHHKIDPINVAGLALPTLYKGIRKDKKALAFHIGFVTLAAINVLLTDWNADTSK